MSAGGPGLGRPVTLAIGPVPEGAQSILKILWYFPTAL